MRISHLLLLAALFIAANQTLPARGSGRITVDLSQHDWALRLDTGARWMDDTLYVVSPPIASLPVHPPTMGWMGLEAVKGPTVHLPATVEEYFWGSNGNAFGLAGNYLGVSWFTTRVNVPVSMTGKRIVLKFESVRFRAEVFVNRMLAGYDLINSTPFDVDITQYVKSGAQNEIAVRITDPNGNFDWRDCSSGDNTGPFPRMDSEASRERLRSLQQTRSRSTTSILRTHRIRKRSGARSRLSTRRR